jgi:hypothetical protein
MNKSLLVAIGTFLLLSSLSSPSLGNISQLKIETLSLESTVVEGGRGAALARLSDDSLLLGGGLKGDTLFHFKDGNLRELGKLMKQRNRIRDSRFGPTDIAVLSQRAGVASILISYPEFNPKKECVQLVLFQYSINLINPELKKGKLWFRGKPCVPLSAVQHAAGRIAVIDSSNVYLTTGDLGYKKIGDPLTRQWLGGVFKVSEKKITQISQGHRNPQGILLIGQDLYISEHGPRGGDELNFIKKGKDYGWPFVTYGQAYSSGDYVRPTKPGTHQGYEEPLYYWVPSVAPTELVKLPNTLQWQGLEKYIVMGTLAELSLIFIELTSNKKVGEVFKYNVGQRIRDLEVLSDGRLVASTDSGALLFISRG